jgi:hypothetical protein
MSGKNWLVMSWAMELGVGVGSSRAMARVCVSIMFLCLRPFGFEGPHAVMNCICHCLMGWKGGICYQQQTDNGHERVGWLHSSMSHPLIISCIDDVWTHEDSNVDMEDLG